LTNYGVIAYYKMLLKN